MVTKRTRRKIQNNRRDSVAYQKRHKAPRYFLSTCYHTICQLVSGGSSKCVYQLKQTYKLNCNTERLLTSFISVNTANAFLVSSVSCSSTSLPFSDIIVQALLSINSDFPQSLTISPSSLKKNNSQPSCCLNHVRHLIPNGDTSLSSSTTQTACLPWAVKALQTLFSAALEPFGTLPPVLESNIPVIMYFCLGVTRQTKQDMKVILATTNRSESKTEVKYDRYDNLAVNIYRYINVSNVRGDKLSKCMPETPSAVATTGKSN